MCETQPWITTSVIGPSPKSWYAMQAPSIVVAQWVFGITPAWSSLLVKAATCEPAAETAEPLALGHPLDRGPRRVLPDWVQRTSLRRRPIRRRNDRSVGRVKTTIAVMFYRTRRQQHIEPRRVRRHTAGGWLLTSVDDPVDLPRSWQAFQLMLAACVEGETRSSDEILHRCGDKNLWGSAITAIRAPMFTAVSGLAVDRCDFTCMDRDESARRAFDDLDDRGSSLQPAC